MSIDWRHIIHYWFIKCRTSLILNISRLLSQFRTQKTYFFKKGYFWRWAALKRSKIAILVQNRTFRSIFCAVNIWYGSSQVLMAYLMLRNNNHQFKWLCIVNLAHKMEKMAKKGRVFFKNPIFQPLFAKFFFPKHFSSQTFD